MSGLTLRAICEARMTVFELTDDAWSGARRPESVAFATPDQAGSLSAVTAVSLWFDGPQGASGSEWWLVETRMPHASHPPRTAREIANSGLRFAVGRDASLAAMAVLPRAEPPAPAPKMTPADIVESTTLVGVDGETVEFAMAQHDAHFGLGARLGAHSIRIAGHGHPAGISLRALRSVKPYSAA